MSRYYLLMDYTVPIFTDYGNGHISMTGPLKDSSEEKAEFYRENPHIPFPRTKRILDLERDLKLYVAFYDVDVGHFVIKARSRRNAYKLATILRALFSFFYGWQPDERSGHYFLQEIKRLPQPDWDDKRMLAELQEVNYGVSEHLIYELRHGYSVMERAYSEVPSFITRIWGNTDLIEALDHMLESRFLFCGFMVGSYYLCHYAKDRKFVPKWEMEKRYFENRFRYETAFIAAFKGIERFFGVNNVKKHKVDAIVNRCSHLGITPDTVYTRYHEIFSGHNQKLTYRELICHFLQLRNIVAAHGSRKPPAGAKLIEDNIFEIQLFLMELICKAIYGREDPITVGRPL